MDFITIDFETATANRNSACEIGLTFVSNCRIVETKSWLIQPVGNVFNYFNIQVHGIRPEDVAQEPTFDQLWHEIGPLVENEFLIAHNAGFDMGVLRGTLDTYGIPYPSLQYACSYQFSRKVWLDMPRYDLKTLCTHNNINFRHHRAGADSRATAELTLKAFERTGVTSMHAFVAHLGMKTGQLYAGGYNSSSLSGGAKRRKSPLASSNPEKRNPNSIFFGKTVVITGTLSAMTRTEAQQQLTDLGAISSDTLTPNTHYLIVGEQDVRIVGSGKLSSKQKKGLQFIAQGAALEFMHETVFLQHLKAPR